MTTEQRLEEIETEMQRLDKVADALNIGRDVVRFANAAARDKYKKTNDDWKRLYWEADRCRAKLWIQNNKPHG